MGRGPLALAPLGPARVRPAVSGRRSDSLGPPLACLSARVTVGAELSRGSGRKYTPPAQVDIYALRPVVWAPTLGLATPRPRGLATGWDWRVEPRAPSCSAGWRRLLPIPLLEQEVAVRCYAASQTTPAHPGVQVEPIVPRRGGGDIRPAVSGSPLGPGPGRPRLGPRPQRRVARNAFRKLWGATTQNRRQRRSAPCSRLCTPWRRWSAAL